MSSFDFLWSAEKKDEPKREKQEFVQKEAKPSEQSTPHSSSTEYFQKLLALEDPVCSFESTEQSRTSSTQDFKESLLGQILWSSSDSHKSWNEASHTDFGSQTPAAGYSKTPPTFGERRSLTSIKAPSEKLKTVLCKFWLKTGSCKFGKKVAK